jgi:HEAT repeat protein
VPTGRKCFRTVIHCHKLASRSCLASFNRRVSAVVSGQMVPERHRIMATSMTQVNDRQKDEREAQELLAKLSALKGITPKQEKAELLKRLILLGPAAVIACLKAFDDPRSQTLAVKALGLIGDESAIPRLAQLLNQGEGPIGYAIQALADIGTDGAVAALLDAVRHQDSSGRSHIARALGRLRPMSASATLLALLETADDEQERYAIVEALADVSDDKSVEGLIAAFESQTRSSWNIPSALARTGHPLAMAALLRWLKGGEQRHSVISAVGAAGIADAVPELIRLLDASEHSTRYAATKSLLAVAAPGLSRDLAKNASTVLAAANWILDQSKDERIVQASNKIRAIITDEMNTNDSAENVLRGGAEEATVQRAEDVYFKLFHPKQVFAGKWYTLLLYGHVESATEEVLLDSRRFSSEMGEAVREVRSGKKCTPLNRGTLIQLVPSGEGLEFNPPSLSMAWNEDFERANLRFRTSREHEESSCQGEIAVFVGPIQVASLRFTAFVDAPDVQPGTPSEEQVVVDSGLYRKVFASYSHKDTAVVNGCAAAVEALGHTVLIDSVTLRSGERWERGLERMIDEADIFQLFWSENSSTSAAVKKEWTYALANPRRIPGRDSRTTFIRPTYWQEPMPDPPKELSHLHFKFAPRLTSLANSSAEAQK